MECFWQAGYTGVPKFEEKEKLLKEVCYFFVIDKSRSAIEQFKDGLATLEILRLIKEHPQTMQQCFCYDEKPLTA